MDKSKAIDKQTAIIREAGSQLISIINDPELDIDTRFEAEKAFVNIQGHLTDLLLATRGPFRD